MRRGAYNQEQVLAVASGATPIGNAVRVPDEIIKERKTEKKER